jgi:hypothetical protein
MVARVDHRLRGGGVGLFDKAFDARYRRRQFLPDADIAIAGFGRGRGDTEGDEPAFLNQRQRGHDRGVEGGDIGDQMVAGHYQQWGLGVIDRERGEGDGRRGVAGAGFKDDRGVGNACLTRLLFDQGGMRGVADDQRRGEEIAVHHPRQCHLKHRRIASEFQELLGAFRGRHRPKPRTASAGEDDRGYLHNCCLFDSSHFRNY